MKNKVIYVILACVFLFRFLWALLYPSILWPDEIYQSLEPAHRLVFGYGVIPWEFKEGIRSWFVPMLLAFPLSLGSLLGWGSYGYLSIVSGFLTLLSLFPVLYGYKFAFQQWGRKEAILLALILGFSPFLAWMAPKACYEVLSTHFFFASLLLLMDARSSQRLRLFASGLCFGLAFCIRLQYLPAYGIFLIYLYWKQRGLFLKFMLGFFSIVLIFGLLDAVTWSYPFASFILYFKSNFINKAADAWGVFPWYFYGKLYAHEFRLALIPLSILAVIGAFIERRLIYIFLAVLIPHSFIHHKEIRFVYLGTVVMLFLSMIGSINLLHYFKKRGINERKIYLFFTIFWVSSFIYFTYSRRIILTYAQDNVLGFRYLSLKKDMCGLLTDDSTLNAPGYYNLHQNIPLLRRDRSGNNLSKISSANYLFCEKSYFKQQSFSSYSEETCFGDMCV